VAWCGISGWAAAYEGGPMQQLERVRTEFEYRWKITDNVLNENARRQIYDFLLSPGWRWGWKSDTKRDVYSFWHKHFAGWKKFEEEESAPLDCAHELGGVLLQFWKLLNEHALPGYTLSRCYANAFQYGTDGTLHTDSLLPDTVTAIYYPHEKWYPNWGGETMFFNESKTDVLGCVYPKPNRLVVFDGRIPHVARGVARTCPVLRITLMFKAWRRSLNS
jgi:SM-20-related protein